MGTTKLRAVPRQGDLVAERYMVEEVLGVGGMGAVVAAMDLSAKRRVAVKIMLPHLASQDEPQQRFLREARAMTSLRSEHVVRVLDTGQIEEQRAYLVMELLDGVDLEKLLRRDGPLSIADATRYLLEACEAVAEAHSLGIIHRDLKPSNLFLAERAEGPPIIKVLDFGVAKPTRSDNPEEDIRALTVSGTTLGSPQYMSPEQLKSAGAVDTRADLWSLGMILHRLLTNRTAFEASSVGETLAMLVAASPTPVRVRRPDAPVELEQIILRCLQKDPERRFQNAGQLAIALAPFAPDSAEAVVPRIKLLLGEEAVSTRPPSLERAAPPTLRSVRPPPPPPRPPGRGRIALYATLALLVSVVVTVAVQLVLHRGTAATPEPVPAPRAS